MMDAAPGLPTPPASTPALPAFQCGPRVYFLDDILEAARNLGEFARYRSDWLTRQGAAQAAETEGLSPDSAAVDTATEAFRYARDLVSAEECERWLEARGLVFEDLVGCVTRRLQSNLAELGDPLEPTPEHERLLRNDALLADEFNAWAKHLAQRIAVAAEAGRTIPGEASLTALWPELEAGFAAVTAAIATPERRQRALAGQRLELMRVSFDFAEFDSADAVREAILCAGEDGTTLRETAEANAFPCQTAECFLGDLPAAWAELLTSARVGEAVAPPVGDDRIVALSLLSRREPSLEDTAVCQRIDEALIRQHFRELESRHIRWSINVELTS
jgi:hypothetical protein